jgi:hypothetical protein
MNEVTNLEGEHVEISGLKGNLDAFKRTLEIFKKVA